MVVRKRSKKSRDRGSWSHGGGHKKKRRGAGSRGGRGRGGFGKRGQQRMPTAQTRKEILGKHGFIRHGQKKDIQAINLDDLNLLIEKGTIKDKVDLGELGYNKLLGSGRIAPKLQVKVDYFSKKAEEKIKEAGGEILKPEEIKIKEKKSSISPKKEKEQ